MFDSCNAVPAQRPIKRIDARIGNVRACGVQVELVRVKSFFHGFLFFWIEKNITTAKNAMIPTAHGIHKGAKTHPQFNSGCDVFLRMNNINDIQKRMIEILSVLFIGELNLLSSNLEQLFYHRFAP